MTSPARENILAKITKSLRKHQLPKPFPEVENKHDFFAKDDLSLEEKFVKEFTALGGKFVYCDNENEMMQQLQALADTMNWSTIHTKDHFLLQLFKDKEINLVQPVIDMQNMEVGLSGCECVVARTGSIILSSAQDYGRSLPVYAPIHIAIAFTNQVVWNISDSISFLDKKYGKDLPSMISLTTGPSRTADIEKTLVVGVHGPKEVYLFLVDSNWKDTENK